MGGEPLTGPIWYLIPLFELTVILAALYFILQNLIVVGIAACAGIVMSVGLNMLIEQSSPKFSVAFFQDIGQNTMCILALHLLAYSFVRTFYAFLYQLPAEEIERIAIIPDNSWTLTYVGVSIAFPLMVNWTIRKSTNEIQKIFHKCVNVD